MIFTELPLPGAYAVELQELRDERGFFARSYCPEEFAARGLGPALGQLRQPAVAAARRLLGMVSHNLKGACSWNVN